MLCGGTIPGRVCAQDTPDVPPMRKKHDLPHKMCPQCGLPFSWRKKWSKVWDEVKYCSDRCRNERKRTGTNAT
jgi:hypothetical protein